MSYRPDYEHALNQAVQAVIEKPPEHWGLLALTAVGVCIVVMGIVVALEALRVHCTHTEDQAASSTLRAPHES